MEEKKPIMNLVTVTGEITRIFEKRSEKAPTNFRVKIVETREIERNGIKEDLRTTTHIDATAWDFPADLTEGDVVTMYGNIRKDHYTDKEGKEQWVQRLYFYKFNKIGHNETVDQDIPTDIPEGEVSFDNIPF